MDKDSSRDLISLLVIMQLTSAHHRRHISGVRPHSPYLLPQTRPTGNLDGVCELYVARAALVSRFVKNVVCIIR